MEHLESSGTKVMIKGDRLYTSYVNEEAEKQT